MRSATFQISHGAGWTTRVHASPNLRGLRRRRRQPITRRNIQFRSLSSSDKVVEKRLQKSFILTTTSGRVKTSKLYNKKPLWWGQHKRGILRTNQATTRWTPTRKVPSITKWSVLVATLLLLTTVSESSQLTPLTWTPGGRSRPTTRCCHRLLYLPQRRGQHRVHTQRRRCGRQQSQPRQQDCRQPQHHGQHRVHHQLRGRGYQQSRPSHH